MQDVAFKRLMLDIRFPDLLSLYEAKRKGAGDSLATDCRKMWEDFQKQISLPLITGADLIALGWVPGPAFAKILHEVEDLVLERKIATKEEALAWVKQLHKSYSLKEFE
jgi:hypothetical protein